MTTAIRSERGIPLISSETHQRVLDCGTDVPEQPPSFALPLDEVGISGKTLWVTLPEGRLPFEATVTIDLPAEHRGIHMSRIEQAVTDLYEQRFSRLSDYAVTLAAKVAERQQGGNARVVIEGKRPLLRHASISGHVSVDPLLCRVEAQVKREKDGLRTQVANGIAVCHITACPCTQVYNHEVFSERGDCPMPTHSQRSQTWLFLSGPPPLPADDELLSCLEEALHLTQDLLKRPDEAEIVLKSHRFPQFAEDAVRETARAVARRFSSGLPAATGVIIESLSLESIHIHNVCCRLSTNLGALCARL
ncbi:MAG: GTP cyclohydrolase, FolE2/MptA family [Thermodesulfobacteriota bacterium]